VDRHRSNKLECHVAKALGAPSEPTARLSTSGAEPFFTRIHDPRLMANVTVSAGRSGPVEVLVQLEDPEKNPLGR
jgi:hypothetical protein